MAVRSFGMVLLARGWWTFLVRGVLAILFGIAAFVWPGATLLVLVYLFAIWAIVDGVSTLVSAFQERGRAYWWVALIEGIVGVAAGIVAIAWPGITALVLLFLIAAWAVVTGLFEVIAAVRLRQEIENEWWLAVAGSLSIVFGVVLFVFPGAGILSLIWLLAAYAIVWGIVLLALGWRLRGVNQRLAHA